jgi:formylglycine-generating enzyme required for sulfatase activity
MDAVPKPARLGEYLLKECLSETESSRRWMAEQESVRRTVIIEELKPGNQARMDAFLANVRAKAAVDHPSIGTVFEAVSNGGECYCALEVLPGATLADRLRAGEPLKPSKLAYYLRRVAEANLYHEARGHATGLFGPEAVHIDDAGVVRMENLVVAGERDPKQSVRDVVNFGTRLPALVADGLPGATRILTLLGWMRGEQQGEPLPWKTVLAYCEQIEQQLAELVPAMTPMTAAVVRPKKFPVLPVVAGVVAVVALVVFLFSGGGRKPRPSTKGELPEAVLIEAGEHPSPDGGKGTLRAFRIAAHEVTIGEYRDFLEALAMHAKNGRSRMYDHDKQPIDKPDHAPADWAALLGAAVVNGTWQGREVSLDSPVVGVDWWDAVAYAEWKKARLPSQEEWFAALRSGIDEPAKLAPGTWQAVTAETPDRTRNGLLGMAGSVAEWTARTAVPPDNPAGRPQWVLIGGSYLNQTNGALSREWIEDRGLRRPDLGFRLVYAP